MISLNDFVDDTPWTPDPLPLVDFEIENQIAGVRLQRLITMSDNRGDLTVLMSNLHDADQHTPHVYLVTAKARSIRAWVYHKRQSDRLAYTQGDIRVVLYNLRPDSPTHAALNVLDVGAANKLLLTIPPFVAHGVHIDQDAQFMNMPTRL